MTDYKALGRKGGQSTRGERKGTAKLTEAQVRAIRASQKLMSELSAEYGVSPSTIAFVLKRVTWRHV